MSSLTLSPPLAPVLDAIDHEIAAHKAALTLAEAARVQLHALTHNGGVAIHHAASPLTGALLEYVSTHPGTTRNAVVDAALGSVPTKSRDPRKNVQTRLGQLITRHRVVERGGRLYAA